MRHGNIGLFIPHLGCPHDCVFCDQRAISGTAVPPSPDDVSAAVRTAIESGKDPGKMQIAFFGGSFTAVEVAYRKSLLEVAAKLAAEYSLAGIRVSTRPDCLAKERIEELLFYGVTDVELGIQSMDDRVLAASGRGHTAADSRKAAVDLKKAGIAVSGQMMLGLPESTKAAEWACAKELLALTPAGVRIYPVVVIDGTRLAEKYRAGGYTPLTLDAAVSRTADLITLFEGAGVPILRAGLHAEKSLEEKLLAGPYHPAFRQLCETKRIHDRILSLAGNSREFTVVCPKRIVNVVIGNKKQGLLAFQNEGLSVKIKVTDETDELTVVPKE